MNDLADLNSNDLGTRARAIFRLCATEQTDTAILAKLFDMAARAPEFAERQYARAALDSFSTSAPWFLERLKAADPGDRVRAIGALMGLRCAGHKLSTSNDQVLTPRSGKNPAWGETAAGIVARCIELLRDEHSEVRLAAAMLLDECGEATVEALDVFVAELRSASSAEVMSERQLADANNIALLLGRIGPAATAACDALRLLSNSPDHLLALASKQALKKITPHAV